ncbi:uncharacterized protein LOC121751556 isoform X1 [Salvia splendens]|uniref:uncharacterized protein LOC121751556 isoform X1 n=1 Tax=Salvia splendens TaxID=180675 RepID=UPI001C257ED4|nr:uncharacterized protein LOC121751556 isoform X1 [Salvia splendens]
MATSAFKSTTKRATSEYSDHRRSRSLSRFSRSIAPEPEADMDYIKNAPRGKFVNTARGPFPEISLDDLALELFSSSSKNESDGGAVEREGRSASRRGEVGRWASDTASSRRRGRSVSRSRGDAASISSASSGPKNAVSRDDSSRRRRSVSVARNATPNTDKNAVVADLGTRRRRSLSVARSSANAVPIQDKDAVAADAGTRRRRSMSVARYQISDSESDIDCSQNTSNRATMIAPTSGNTHLHLASKTAASSYRLAGRARSQIDLSMLNDDYSSQSSALTDDESKDTRFGRNGSEKIIRAVHAQKKADHPSEEVANGGLYAVMRKELRHAVEEIRTELHQAMGKCQIALPSNDCSLSENAKIPHDSFRIREKYAKKLEQLEKQKKNLLAEMLLEEQCDQEVSETYEELSNSRASGVTEKPPQARKRSSDRSRLSDRLTEDAERYFEDFISNIEDTDLSSFDGERSDGSSTLRVLLRGRRDFTIGEAETCRTPAGSTSCPAEMDGVIFPWLQWETSHDGSPCGKTELQNPTTPHALHRDSEKESSQLHDASSFSVSSHSSWSPGPCHSSSIDKREKVCPTKAGNDSVSKFDMDEYLNLQNKEEMLFEMYRERNRIGLGGLLLCTGGLH